MVFLIDNEEAFLRHLAAKSWRQDYVTEDDKKLQERLKRENAEAVSRNFQAMLDEIKSNKCKTGQEDPRKKKKMLPDNFSKTVVSYA